MATNFLSGTPFSGLEKMMWLYPGVGQRRPGYSHFVYTAADCDYKYCTEYKGKEKKCRASDCVCFPGRLLAGCLTYRELVRKFTDEVNGQIFTARAEAMLSASGTVDSFFMSPDHEKRFCDTVVGPYIYPAYLSTIFLLSANTSLYNISKNAFSTEMIYFIFIDTGSLDSNDLLILKAARDLYEVNLHITLADLLDPKLFNDNLLRLIINTFIVRRYGLVMLNKKVGGFVQ